VDVGSRVAEAPAPWQIGAPPGPHHLLRRDIARKANRMTHWTLRVPCIAENSTPVTTADPLVTFALNGDRLPDAESTSPYERNGRVPSLRQRQNDGVSAGNHAIPRYQSPGLYDDKR
jgi:hypothetical protein